MEIILKPKAKTIREVPCRCIDGRTKGARYSIPGGSFSLIFNTLFYYKVHNQSRYVDLKTILKCIADDVTPIYLHSDVVSVRKAVNQVEVTHEDILNKLNQSVKSYSDSFINNMGCGHLRTIYENSSKESKELMSSLLEAFWALFHENDPRVFFEILEGEHSAQAVLLVEGAEELPLVEMDAQDCRDFVFHKEVEKELLSKIQGYLLEKGWIKPPLKDGDLISWMDKQAERTLGILNPDLEIKEISIGNTGIH